MEEKDPNKKDAPGDFFFDNLVEVSDGRLLMQLDDRFKAVIGGVMKTGNKGTLTLTIAVKRKGGEGQVEITPAVKATVPQKDIPSRILFASEDGNLHVNDPNQGTLDLDAPTLVMFPKQKQA